MGSCLTAYRKGGPCLRPHCGHSSFPRVKPAPSPHLFCRAVSVRGLQGGQLCVSFVDNSRYPPGQLAALSLYRDIPPSPYTSKGKWSAGCVSNHPTLCAGIDPEARQRTLRYTCSFHLRQVLAGREKSLAPPLSLPCTPPPNPVILPGPAQMPLATAAHGNLASVLTTTAY